VAKRSASQSGAMGWR